MIRKILAIGVALLLMGSGGWWFLRDRSAPAAEGGHAVVKRGDFTIVITEQGSFAAKESVELKVEPEAFQNQLTLTKITAAGTAVKKDEVVFEFDRTEITRILSTAQVDLQAAKNDLVQVSEDLKIQKLQNAIDMERAHYNHEVALQSLKKWQDLEAPKAIKEADSRVADAQTALDEAVTNHQVLVKMKQEDLVSEAEVRRAELTVRKSENELEFTRLTLKQLKEYDHPLNLKRLENEIRDTKSYLDGKQSAIESIVAQKESAVLRAQNAVKEKEDYVAKLTRDVERLTVKAPVDGIVLHGDANPWQQRAAMKVGSKVQAYETLGTIPDLSAFKVNIGVTEADVNKVKPAMIAIVKPEALPDLTMKATVKTVSTVVNANRWWDQSSQNKFDVELDLDGVDTRLKPGMKCKVEIGVDEVKNALHVPLDAVFEKDGKSIAWLIGGAKPEERVVKTGRSSADYVEILDGLKEGEKVALYDPLKK